MPRINVLLDRLGGATYIAKLDMTKGYWEVPIALGAVALTGFVTPHGHYQWRYMAFGLRNAPTTFSRASHLSHLRSELHRIRAAQLKLNIRKCEFANSSLDFLGHRLGLNMVQPRHQKVEALLKFPPPTNNKQVQPLLGFAGYYRKSLPHFADPTLPLTALLKKNVAFKWTEAANSRF